jgi:hypothetical protein
MTNLAPHALQKKALPLAFRHAFDFPFAAGVVKKAMPGWKNITRA